MTVLHLHLEAAGGADAAHRRRRHADDEGLLDGGEFLVQRRAISACALWPFSARSLKGSSGVNTTAAFGALVKVAPSSPTIGTACAMPGRVEHDLGDLARHLVGARERGAGRQLDDVDEIALVLLRDEAGRRLAELIDGEPDQPGIDRRA